MKASIKKLIVASFTILLAAPVFAQGSNTQNQGAQNSGGYVVVLDVAKVFRVNKQFDTALKGIQAEAEGLKGQITTEQQNLKNQADQVMEQFKPGTPDFQREETRLEQELAALRTKARQMEAELLKKEAKLYQDTYVRMQQVVAQICEEFKIDLVLRFDSSEIDPSNRADVIKGVNRGVVFQKDRDITEMVIQNMGPRVADSSVIQQNK